MFQLFEVPRSTAEITIYTKVISFLLSYGLTIGIGIVILLVVKQLNKLLNFTVKDLVIIMLLVYIADYFFGLSIMEYIRLGIISLLS